MTAIKDLTTSLKVPVASLRKACDPLQLRFERSDELPESKPYLGQQRAIDAIRFGIDFSRDGYNIFILGPHGSDRHGLARELAGEQAASREQPKDWCYVNNFSDAECPRTLRFPAGEGTKFRDDMKYLIDDLRLAIPATFESDDYRNRLKELEEGTKKELEELWASLNELAARDNIGVLNTPTGYVLAPISKGAVLSDEEFAKLPDEKRKDIESAIERLSAELQSRIEMIPKLQKKHREELRRLTDEVTKHAVGILLADLRRKYSGYSEVIEYLDEAQQDIIENVENFLPHGKSSVPFLSFDPSQAFARYEVNLLVKNERNAVAPTIYEPNPSYQNIIGKVEHRAEMGALITDFRMIRPGALHRANGGFLILDMQRVLSRPFVWEGLKEALSAKRIRIESPAETYGLVSTTSLQPEPIPLDIKIVLIGERWLYYLLCMYDNEFNELFSVAADLDDDLKRTDDNVQDYALLIATRARKQDLLPLSAAAVLRVVEERARYVEDSEMLSTHMRSLDDLLMQSDYWARNRKADVVDREDVIEAIRQKKRRFSRMQSRVLDAIDRDTLLIDTSGSCVGQVNGLSIVDLGEFRYGHPVRITATTRIGNGDVVDIEREVELGGAIHSKGMMILSAALSARYAREIPLSLRGNVVFEQSYGGVEGDSASVAEFCALLSSLSEVPIRQNLAVTGSVNQLGRVQVVGGINDKIEGFYDVCKRRGLDGTHGVVIPRDNVKHLMLREGVVRAIEQGQFSVFAVSTIDEALSVLTGVEAGERDSSGNWQQDSVNDHVEKTLVRYAKLRKDFAESGGSRDSN